MIKKIIPEFTQLIITVCGLLVIAIFVWLAWNTVAPDIFGLKPLNYLQAFSLLVLVKILTHKKGTT